VIAGPHAAAAAAVRDARIVHHEHARRIGRIRAAGVHVAAAAIDGEVRVVPRVG